MTTYGTITTNGISLSAAEAPAPARAPKGLIVTRAVEVKAGWVGQIIVDQDIVWESQVYSAEVSDDLDDSPSELAEEAATERVLAAIKDLFVDRLAG